MVIFNGTGENAEDIVQCAGTILSTPYGSMPYMRGFGITMEALKEFAREEDGSYYAQASGQIEAWEERAQVSSITCVADGSTVKPKVVLEDGG